MNRLFLALVVTIMAMTMIAGCSQAVPAPTQAPAKSTEPTKAAAPAAQPTAVPAAKATWPEKGRAITMIVPWAAGGAMDLSARLLAGDLEKMLGTPVQVANKAGASGQVGTTELAKAKPDGYTIGLTAIPSTSTIYLDPERLAAFGRKDLIPVAMHTSDPMVIGVMADSKYKTVQDLVDDAKANPERIKVGSSGIMSVMHLASLQFQKATGTKFAIVQFDGGAQQPTAVLGGHIDASFELVGTLMPQIKPGNMRALAVLDSQENRYLPGVKTLESQGYKVQSTTARGLFAPAGMPKEIVDTISSSVKKIMDSPEHQKKLDELGINPRYMDSAGFGSYWDQVDEQVKSVLDQAKQK